MHSFLDPLYYYSIKWDCQKNPPLSSPTIVFLRIKRMRANNLCMGISTYFPLDLHSCIALYRLVEQLQPDFGIALTQAYFSGSSHMKGCGVCGLSGAVVVASQDL